MLYILDLFGTLIFAISGILQARRLRMDIFGMLVLATVTAVGGGTIRDLALGVRPVFWVQDYAYLAVIVSICVLSSFVLRFSSQQLARQLLVIFDAIGLATFTAIGVEKALAYEATTLAVICMGVLTGVGGGIIRDVLAREIPMVLRKEIYATACIAGGSIHITFIALGTSHVIAIFFGLITTLCLRLAAIRWNIHLPIVGEKSTP